MNHYKYCEDVAQQSGSSFYYSFFLLSPEQRKAITAIYAFCRHIDDIVDDANSKEVASIKLNWWRHEIDLIYQGKPNHPIGRSICKSLEYFQLPKKPFVDLINGMEMDINRNRYHTYDELLEYCYHVASTVGLLSINIFGYQDPNTTKYAELLGKSFQLINIIRDVGEDANRNRIYLAQEDLDNFSIKQTEILTGNFKNQENFQKLLALYAKRAREFYHIALDNLSDIDRYDQRCGLVMAKSYQALLDKIEQSDYSVYKRKIRLSTLVKIWLACRTIWDERQA